MMPRGLFALLASAAAKLALLARTAAALSLTHTPPCREVGGQMMPLWPVYYRECSAVAFVIDAADAAALPTAAVELFEALGHEALQVC